ncbi:MAG: MotA/TolQ/ExbB proton channel family protein, partial [Cyclobacteriaceae bacterium]|nr:MotA/TolQ/ExbB proton channel family protein [Cyclobacteriaceae bacterium]
MKFIEIHIEGGIEFMSILFVLLLGTLATGVVALIHRKDAPKRSKWITINQDMALFALVWGILGQTVGLFSAFQAIETMGEVSQAVLAGGLKISSYTTIYGLVIFLIGKIFKLIANFLA